MHTASLEHLLNQQIVSCQLCPRLNAHCQAVAQKKRPQFADSDYWGKPVPNLGSLNADLLIIGLAPAAHGANRTGRMFTGDRSGDFLYPALHQQGFCNQKTGTHAKDGLVLQRCAITAICHCAPPANKPTPNELENCSQWLKQTYALFSGKVVLFLGQMAFDQTWRCLKNWGHAMPKKPKFGHGQNFSVAHQWWFLSYHPSPRNTFTGKLTEAMFVEVLEQIQQKLARS